MTCIDTTKLDQQIKQLQILASSNAECTEQNKSDIAALQDQITALETVIVDLDTRVTNLENSIPSAQVITTSSLKEDDCHVNVRISDGALPTFEFNEDNTATAITVTGGSGLNGAGRIYTLSFPAHPNGANYAQHITVWDDNNGDTGIPEIISKTSTSLTYQIAEGDDGASEDDNDFYRHEVKISGTEQTFISQVLVNGIPV